MARWRILDGPTARPNTRGVDGDIWGATLENVNDPAQRRLIQVVIARSVLASDPDGLLDSVRAAVVSEGRSAIEGFLEERVPPRRLLVSSSGVRVVEDE